MNIVKRLIPLVSPLFIVLLETVTVDLIFRVAADKEKAKTQVEADMVHIKTNDHLRRSTTFAEWIIIMQPHATSS